METYSIAALLSAAVILLSVLFLVRRRNRTQQAALLAREEESQNFKQIELTRVQNPTEYDLRAYALIESKRQQVWTSFSTKTAFSPRIIYQFAFDLIREVAAIYYPDLENPVMQASIFDLLELNYRIIERVKEYLEEFPLNTIRDLNIQNILKYKDYYDKLSDSKLVQFAQQHTYLYAIGKYAWMGYNVLNPWYWGRKIVFTAGKEGLFRYLLTVIITVVGEEAVLVYSRRNIKAKAAAVEKNIAFEMINMAVIDGIVSAEEYEVILDFILQNPQLDDQRKVTLLKALLRKRPLKSAVSFEMDDEKAKKRLLAEVERVAKADQLGILKKREALKSLEESLALTSAYRTQLESAPHAEIQSRNLMQQHRQREEAILRLMVQAGAVEGVAPDSLREYIMQRAESYPLPFNEEEQANMLREVTNPTPQDTLTNAIIATPDKERALTEVLDALLWYLPFTRQKEAFYRLMVSALGLKKGGEAILLKRLEQVLSLGKLIEKPPAELTKYLCRLLGQTEQITALQSTATKYTFITGDAKPKQKDADFWLCVTTTRVLVLAATTIAGTVYQHHLAFGDDLHVQVEPGKLSDTYILRGINAEILLRSPLFRSANLKHALHPYVRPEQRSLSA